VGEATRRSRELKAALEAALAPMPDVGTDEDFEFERDLPRPSQSA
jgi:hypothetical protein